jgi:hypothetical protein
MTLEEEMLGLPTTIRHIGLALVQFVHSLHEGTFEKKNRKSDWIYTANFVAFSLAKRGKIIRMHIDIDSSEEFVRGPGGCWGILHIYAGHHYPVCEITSPRQLACATRYIEAAYRRWSHSHKPQVPPRDLSGSKK